MVDPYLDDVERRLSAMDAEQLRSVLRAQAQHMPRERRAGFLKMLDDFRGPGRDLAAELKRRLSEGSLGDAVEWARAELTRLPEPVLRAELADALAEAAAQGGLADAVLEARRVAWRSVPRLDRLVRYCAQGQPSGKALQARIAEERAQPAPDVGEETAFAALDLLAGDLDAVTRRVLAAGPTAWHGKLGPTLLPLILLAASGVRNPPVGSALSRAFERFESVEGPFGVDSARLALLLRETLRIALGHAGPARPRLLELGRELLRPLLAECVVGRATPRGTARAVTALAEAARLAGEGELERAALLDAREVLALAPAFAADLEEELRSSSVLRR